MVDFHCAKISDLECACLLRFDFHCATISVMEIDLEACFMPYELCVLWYHDFQEGIRSGGMILFVIGSPFCAMIL